MFKVILLKEAENITSNPNLNKTVSPERQTSKYWLSLREQNENKQKTKMLDDQAMPENSKGGYDNTNRFNDADVTSLTPTATLSNREIRKSSQFTICIEQK